MTNGVGHKDKNKNRSGQRDSGTGKFVPKRDGGSPATTRKESIPNPGRGGTGKGKGKK